MGGICRIRDFTMQGLLIFTVALAASVSADAAAPAHGYGYAPEFYCRDTNTSIYAEVCVPAFTDKVTPITLAVKVVVDNDYCFDRVLTICEETSTIVEREICTYTYEKDDVVAPAQTTQVTYETKTETMKVTACKASGYGTPGYGHGEHQLCREEYQTQSYKVPLVTAPLAVEVNIAYPRPVEVCVTKAIEITEVVCRDDVEQKCFNVAKFEDSTNTVDQTEVVIGEPACDQVTLTLPTQSCSHAKPAYGGYHG